MITETSKQSYKSIQPLGKRQYLILNAFTELCYLNGDATDVEVAKYLKVDTNTVRPRRFELVNLYKVIGFNQKRKCKVTKKNVMAWKVLKRNQNKDVYGRSIVEDLINEEVFE